MEQELKQIETLTLRDYIDKEMSKLHQESMEIFAMATEQVMDKVADLISKTARLVILQEIAYRLEYGFITEIGKTSLKHHLVKD